MAARPPVHKPSVGAYGGYGPGVAGAYRASLAFQNQQSETDSEGNPLIGGTLGGILGGVAGLATGGLYTAALGAGIGAEIGRTGRYRPLSSPIPYIPQFGPSITVSPSGGTSAPISRLTRTGRIIPVQLAPNSPEAGTEEGDFDVTPVRPGFEPPIINFGPEKLRPRDLPGDYPRTAYELGVEAAVMAAPRVPPPYFTASEREAWFKGYDDAQGGDLDAPAGSHRDILTPPYEREYVPPLYPTPLYPASDIEPDEPLPPTSSSFDVRGQRPIPPTPYFFMGGGPQGPIEEPGPYEGEGGQRVQPGQFNNPTLPYGSGYSSGGPLGPYSPSPPENEGEGDEDIEPPDDDEDRDAGGDEGPEASAGGTPRGGRLRRTSIAGPSIADTIAAAARAIPGAIRAGVRLANTIGPYLPAPFGGGMNPLTPLFGGGSPDATAIPPTAQPDGGPLPTTFDNQPTPDNTLVIPPAEQPGYPDSSGYCPGGNCAGGPDIFANQPNENQNPLFPTSQPEQLAQQAHQLQDQLGEQMEIEAHQEAQKENAQQVHQIADQLGDIHHQLDQLHQLENQPIDSRDIPAEMARKHQLGQQLNQLQHQIGQLPADAGQPELESRPSRYQGGRPVPSPSGGRQLQPVVAQPVTFCMTCDSPEEAIKFLNGEVGACTVNQGSTQLMGGPDVQ